jgi:hypothetical protein
LGVRRKLQREPKGARVRPLEKFEGKNPIEFASLFGLGLSVAGIRL